MVIFNNVPGLLWDATLNGSVNIPVVLIEQTVGEDILARLEQNQPFSMSVGNLPASYMTTDGTSMASPHVAGIAALVKTANPDLLPEEIQELIKATATPIVPNDDNQFGRGMVNAEAAGTLERISTPGATTSKLSSQLENSGCERSLATAPTDRTVEYAAGKATFLTP